MTRTPSVDALLATRTDLARCPGCAGYGTVEGRHWPGSEHEAPSVEELECDSCEGSGVVLARPEWHPAPDYTDDEAEQALALAAASVPMDVAIARVRELPWRERP